MFILFLLMHLIICSVYSISLKPILIVVSYDGFRYNYIDQNFTPSMWKLRQQGAYAEYIYNVFPTKTFPNHFTIATGMYTEVHGVVGNSFYDPDLKKTVTISEEMFTQNKLILPIWTLNELSGENRYSGVMMWPGCSFAYHNRKPTYVRDWSHKYDIFKRVDKVMEWLTDPKKPANLVMLYMEEPDFHSHIYGPNSKVVYEQIKILDNITQYIDDQLQKHKLKDRATVIHISDHGMLGVKYKNIINVTQYLQPNTFTIADTSPCLHIIPQEGMFLVFRGAFSDVNVSPEPRHEKNLITFLKCILSSSSIFHHRVTSIGNGFEKSIYDNLKKASETLKTFDVYRKEDLLERWHFKHNVRSPQIFLLAKEGYAFQDLLETAQHYKDEFMIEITPDTEFGVHGYDTELPSMHPFFMVRGPRIKRKHLVEPFNFVDLYNFFSNILEITPVANNGSILIHRNILIQKSNFNGVSSVILISVGGVILSLLLIGCAAAITIFLIKKQQNMRTVDALNKRFPQTFQHSIEAQHLLDTEEA